jgi:ATP-dependent Clp endopeptidase proteolytic subunit ClpP
MQLLSYHAAVAATPPNGTKPATPPNVTEPKPSAPATTETLPQVTGGDTVQLRKKLDNTPFDLTVYGDITPTSVQQNLAQLTQYERWYANPDGSMNKERIKQKPITLKIASGGGVVVPGLSLIDKIKDLQEKGIIVRTITEGAAGSMAAMFAISGSKGHRYITPNSTIMLHNVVFSTTGTIRQYLSEIVKDIDYMKQLQNTLTDMIYENSHGQWDKADIKKHVGENYHLRAKEAKAKGLVDHIGFPPEKGLTNG